MKNPEEKKIEMETTETQETEVTEEPEKKGLSTRVKIALAAAGGVVGGFILKAILDGIGGDEEDEEEDCFEATQNEDGSWSTDISDGNSEE